MQSKCLWAIMSLNFLKDLQQIDMIVLKYLFSTVCAYFLGSLSVAIFISRNVMKNDVRAQGSGNAGATNMARVFGLSLGILTLVGDMLKAALGMLLGWLLLGENGMCVCGAAALLGHCYPALHEFRGGKGVSVGAMVFLLIDWRVLAVAVVFFALFAVLSRKVSLGSLMAAVSGFATAAYLGLSLPRLLLAAGAMLLVVARHRENIIRLVKGTEPNFTLGSSKRKESAEHEPKA